MPGRLLQHVFLQPGQLLLVEVGFSSLRPYCAQSSCSVLWAAVAPETALPAQVLQLSTKSLLQYPKSFPGGASGKEFAANGGDEGDVSLIPGREDPLEKETATHSSILAWKIPDRGASWATVHGASKSWTRLSKRQFHFQYPKG